MTGEMHGDGRGDDEAERHHKLEQQRWAVDFATLVFLNFRDQLVKRRIPDHGRCDRPHDADALAPF